MKIFFSFNNNLFNLIMKIKNKILIFLKYFNKHKKINLKTK